MKRLVQFLFGMIGYEIHSKNNPVNVSRAVMSQGLHWLQEQKLSIKTILDVGASDGRWAKECMEEFPEANYVLYEPQPVHSPSLDEFTNSSEGQIISVKKAVGGNNGFLSFDISDPLGGGPATQDSKEVLEVELTTIDSSVSELRLEGPFLLKLDTHGIEKAILQGAEQTLQKCDILIIEAYNYRITGEALLFWELCAYLHEKGFRTIDLLDTMHRKYDNSFWQMDLVFIRSSWEGFDYISYE